MIRYQTCLERLAALGPELAKSPDDSGASRRKWTLEHIRALLAALGQPQSAFKAVLVAGTNGKGSTCATLAAMLTAAGIKTGLYLAPSASRE